MFQDLDSTLNELLRRELAPDILEQVSISFSTPDGQFPPAWISLPTINLFLYELQENRELRDTEPMVERQADGRVMRASAPRRVDCHYLVTAWAKAGAQHPEQDEHRMLGEALRALYRHPEIPTPVLQGKLKEQTHPLRAVVLRHNHQQGRNDFWQALGGRTRAAFNYTVTVGLDARAPEEIGRAAVLVRG